MMRVLYLLAILFGWAGMVVLDRRLGLGVVGRRLLRSVLITVPAFLAFDAAGAARGWFASDPRLNLLILPPGIPLEEPLLLAFLCLVSVAAWRLARRLLG